MNEGSKRSPKNFFGGNVGGFLQETCILFHFNIMSLSTVYINTHLSNQTRDPKSDIFTLTKLSY
jgi:hypothetical protein